MNNYVVTFEFADNSKCSDSKKKVIEYINSYKNSSKLLDNTYWINSFKVLPLINNDLNNLLNPDDKMIIIPFENIIGKNIPNI